MDDDTQQLIAIQQELSGISERLRKIFPSTHPQFDDVFEDMGAAGYYIREAGYRLESVLKTVQGDSDVPRISHHISQSLCRGAGVQGSRGAEESCCTSSFPSAPLHLCPSAPSSPQACEKCGVRASGETEVE